MSDADPPEVSAYIRKLRWGLKGLPDKDVDGIAAETLSHILDRIEKGATVEEALDAIGDVQAYARQFVVEHDTITALASRRTGDLVPALVSNAAGNALAAGALIAIFSLWTIALVFAAVSVMKLFDPGAVGLWVGEEHFFLGILNEPGAARDVLGVWIFPIAFALCVAAFALTRQLALSALQRLARQR